MTDDRFPPDPLDHWLRQHVDADAASISAETPSERVWTGVRAGLQRRKRRRHLLLWWLVLLLGVAGAGWLGQWWSEGGRVKPTTPAANIAEQIRPAPSNTVPPPNQPGTTGDAVRPFDSPEKTVRSANIAAKTRGDKGLALLQVPAWPEASPLLPYPVQPREELLPTTSPKLPSEAPYPAFAPLDPRNLPALSWAAPHPSMTVSAWKKPRPAGWYLGASCGYFFTGRQLRANASGRPNGAEHGAWTWQTGLNAGRTLGRHWSFETGLQWTSLHLQAERRSIVRFRTSQERYDPDRDVYDSSERQQVQTSFGAVELRFELSRRAGQPIHDQETIRLRLQTDERVRYLRLPLALRYTSGRGQWQWGAQAGLGLSLRTGYTLDVTAAGADRSGIVAVQARADRRAAGMAETLADAQFGLEAGYRLSPRWAVRLAPEFRYGVTSLYRQGPFTAYPVTAGLQVGLVWRLGNQPLR